jgi:hypothetical protein
LSCKLNVCQYRTFAARDITKSRAGITPALLASTRKIFSLHPDSFLIDPAFRILDKD